jgi:23S rRNA (adenine2503-C2)-methyltransferase
MGFLVNLTAAEILNQVLTVQETKPVTNIVFMGMGEPLDNLDNVLMALSRLTDVKAFAWSPKRITVSTIGIMPQLQELIEKSRCHVAISLHTAIPDERATWMPAQKAWPGASIIDWLRTVDFGLQRRLSFEYNFFKGLNDNQHHADALLHLLRGLDCRVNLISFHPVPGSFFERADEAAMQQLAAYLNRKGLRTTIRKSRGEDIQAACGLLSTSHRK